MGIKSTLRYSRAVSLDANRLAELEKILKNFCNKITYQTSTFKNEKYDYESIDDLTASENYRSTRVWKLFVFGENNGHNIVTLIFSQYYTRSVFRKLEIFYCTYELENSQQEALFTEQIVSFLHKVTESYWCFTYFRLYSILMVLIYIAILYEIGAMLFGWDRLDIPQPLAQIAPIKRCIIAVVTLILFCLVDRLLVTPLILHTLFPPINFLWGEEKRHYDKITLRRGHIFWNIIVALLIGLAGSFIFRDLLALL